MTSMLLLVLASAVAAQTPAEPPAPATATFVVDRPGLEFTHPKDWKVEKDKLRTRILIPVGESQAVVDVFESNYRQEAKLWQEIQVSMNNALRREVVGQWEEQILGVPLLMTRLKYTEDGKEVRTLVGLLYTATDLKFHFRLTAPSEIYDQAEKLWRDALLTLRTKSGDLPQTEYPFRKPEEPETPAKGAAKPAKPTRTLTMTRDGLRPDSLKKARVEQNLQLPATNLTIYLPKGWSATVEDDTIRLRHPSLKGEVWLEASQSPEDDPARAYVEAGAKALEGYKIVSLRRESQPERAESGSILRTVSREGSKDDGSELVRKQVLGLQQNGWWLLRYECASMRAADRDRGRLEELVTWLGVEWPS